MSSDESENSDDLPESNMSGDENEYSGGLPKLVDIGDVQKLKPKEIFPVNDVTGLQEKLNEIKVNLEWVERLDITSNTSVSGADNLNKQQNVSSQDKAEHDFKREMSFYNQAKAAAEEAICQLNKLNIPTRRPSDYFAEMAKSDDHMTKVREKLMSKKTMLERAEKAREFREQKKHGKKIQQEIMQQKRSEKKKMIDALKKSKKGRADVAKLLENRQEIRHQNINKQGKRGGGKKRRERYKADRYGYGGMKKRSKFNTADSSAFMPGMSKNLKSPGMNKNPKFSGMNKNPKSFTKGKSFARGNKSTFSKGTFNKGKRPKSTRRRR